MVWQRGRMTGGMMRSSTFYSKHKTTRHLANLTTTCRKRTNLIIMKLILVISGPTTSTTPTFPTTTQSSASKDKGKIQRTPMMTTTCRSSMSQRC